MKRARLTLEASLNVIGDNRWSRTLDVVCVDVQYHQIGGTIAVQVSREQAPNGPAPAPRRSLTEKLPCTVFFSRLKVLS